tara:strand:+ start:67 stop:1134 length:1068 start_codon:yes stop_codon:yes gene_type:complete
MDFIINHKRFKKKYSLQDLDKYLLSNKKISKWPMAIIDYFNFFENYIKKNYTLIPTKCLCENNDDILLSISDRNCIEFPIVVCKKCGLIRPKNYFTEKDVKHFYTNHYRKIVHGHTDKVDEDPERYYNMQKNDSKRRIDIIKKFGNISLSNKKVLDLGGGCGGNLDILRNENEVYLADYFEPFLKYAKSKNINVIKGGLESIDFKPDLIICTHVMEHWSNFKEEMKKLIQIQKVGKTINYIEHPGIDSIKLGRRDSDIIGDLCIQHTSYFASYVFENLMNRYGFEKLYIDSEIKSLFVYTGKKQSLVNHYTKVYNDLFAAERNRKIFYIQNFIKLFIPKNLLSNLRKIRNKSIQY